MSDEKSIEEANGDELEAMFARAAMEEEESVTDEPAQSEPEQMHDPLSDVINGAADDEPEEVSLDDLEEDEEPEVDFIGGESADIEIPEEMEEEDGDEPEVDFISEAIGDSASDEAETTEMATAEESMPEESAPEASTEEAPAPAAETTESSPVSRLEDSILNAVELAHEAADLANDVTEVASNTTIEMRELIHDALKQIEAAQPETSSAVIMSDEMNEYIDELKRHSDAIRERTQQLRERIQSLTND